MGPHEGRKGEGLVLGLAVVGERKFQPDDAVQGVLCSQQRKSHCCGEPGPQDCCSLDSEEHQGWGSSLLSVATKMISLDECWTGFGPGPRSH